MIEISKGLENRDNKGRFVKGQSGNAGGRPATPDDVKEMLKSTTVPAVQLLIDTMNNNAIKHDLRVRCAEILIDRVLGKAVQPLEAIFTTPAYDLGDLTVDELRRLAAYEDEPGNIEISEE